MQTVEQLSFILMNPLHMDVKHGLWIDLHLVVLLKIGGKLHLVLLQVQARGNRIRTTTTKTWEKELGKHF